MSNQPSSDTIALTRIWPFGLYADNPSQDSLLFSPLRRIATSGAPTGRVTYLFLQTSEPLPRTAAKGHRLARWWNRLSPTRRRPIFQTLPRLLGSVAYTPSGMLLYFPGYQGTYIHGIDAKTAQPINRRDDFRTHHFSLEPSLDRWHITALDGTRVIKLGVESHGPDEVFWFAMSVREVSDLEPIYRRNRWRFPTPATDTRRRLENVASSSDGAVFQIVQCPDARIDAGQSFWHFEFTVRRSPIQGFPQPPLHLPPTPLATVTSKLDHIPIRSHVVRLPGISGGIIILTTRVSGTLSAPILLTHRVRRQSFWESARTGATDS